MQVDKTGLRHRFSAAVLGTLALMPTRVVPIIACLSLAAVSLNQAFRHGVVELKLHDAEMPEVRTGRHKIRHR